MTSLDRDGTVIDTDKAVWPQGRFAWMLATLYNTVERREEWLEGARSCIEFLDRHGFDDDGRMFFLTTREGKPLRKRRYVYSESFAAMAFAAWARATGDDRAASRAGSLLEAFLHANGTPGVLEPKVYPSTREAKSFGVPMIALGVAQTLRDTTGYERSESIIDGAIEEIRRDFVRDDLEVVLETVAPDGGLIDHFDGRTLNPGHAIEGAWFILEEARKRDNDPDLIALGTRMIDYMWKRGWDEEHGGLFYFRDLRGLPVQEYWHDMKFWWPHCEAIIATLLAYHLTGDERYAAMHRQVHEWTFARFPDREYGEWYGYLHRDGGVSSALKGNWWKGPYHIPRMLGYCSLLFEGMEKQGSRR
jgi:N-acylglucosamine 2-epimerase